MKKKIFFAISLAVLTSCCKDEVTQNCESNSTSLPDAQVYITEMKVKDAIGTKTYSDVSEAKNVSFEDFISGKSYSFDIITHSKNNFGVDINRDGTEDLIMTIDGNKICGTIGENSDVVYINTEKKDGLIVFNMQQPDSVLTKGYTHISWWSCVKRLVCNEDLCIFNVCLPGYVAGAAAIVCLDGRNRWEVD